MWVGTYLKVMASIGLVIIGGVRPLGCMIRFIQIMVCCSCIDIVLSLIKEFVGWYLLIWSCWQKVCWTSFEWRGVRIRSLEIPEAEEFPRFHLHFQ